MSRQKGLDTLIDGLPAEPPKLPIFSCTSQSELLDVSGDASFARQVVLNREWSDAQYQVVKAAAADEPEASSTVEVHAFRSALAFVLSRALRIEAPKPVGTRRVLVPALDLANHAENPSAVYSYSQTRGGVIRLHAARRVQEGEPVTIKYGDGLSSAHFATYYGFVPRSNAANSVRVPLARVMAFAPPPLGQGTYPQEEKEEEGASASSSGDGRGWWTAERIREAGADDAALFELHASAPSAELLSTMRALLSSQPVVPPDARGGCVGGFAFGPAAIGPTASVTRAVGRVAEAEAQLLLEGAEAAADATAEASGSSNLDEGRRLLLALRQSRLELLQELTRSMGQIAERFEAASGIECSLPMAAAARVMLEEAVIESEMRPYPVSWRQFESWEAREWDWEAFTYIE